MANQDTLMSEMAKVRHLHFGVRQNHNMVNGQNSSFDGLTQDQLPHMNAKQVHENEIGLGESISHGYYMVPAIDHELTCDQEEYDQDGECKSSKYNDDDDHNELTDFGNEEAGINQDDGSTDNHDTQLALMLHDEGLGFAENNGLAVEGNHEIDESFGIVVHQNPDMGTPSTTDLCVQNPPYVITTPIVQCRTMIPAPMLEITVGQEFPDVHSCRRALRDLAIALHFEIQTVKSDKMRFTAKCSSEGCPWRVHAAKLPGVPTFTIRTIQAEHNCGGIDHLGHQQASVEWVANSVEQRLRENPHCKPKEILEEIHRVHGITLSYKQAWRGKERFMASLRGSYEEDFKLLPQYCKQLRRANPGSIASVYVNEVDNSFQRLFISYQASIYGFLNACRPLIGLDRTILKNKYLGTLLIATGFDGDGELFPLAFGVVNEENDENWMWFISELHSLLETNTENMPRLAILSDRQRGIVDAVDSNFPTAFHGYCMLHLSNSFRKEFNNSTLVNLLWEAANALTTLQFDSKILEIEEISQDAAYWVRRVPPRLWANSHFEGTRFGHLTANTLESMNAWILEASGLPIVQMMESIRRQLMTWFNERREASMQWTSILVPFAERHVSEALERAQTYQVFRSKEAEFEVISHEGNNTVNIRNRICFCRGWEVYGLPCSHAVAALLSCRQNVHRFTESCFTVATYRKAYSQTIHPIPDRTHWQEISGESLDGGFVEDITVNPPKLLRPPGQPRKRRNKSGDRIQSKRVVHCSRCNQTGHFRTTCTAPI